MLTLQAPAKINLTLEVLSKRPDGYHEIRSIIQAISLADTLHFETGSEVDIESDMASWRAPDSLVSKAVMLVREAAGVSSGVAIYVEKRIPMMGGLGGDSSDAAAVLLGLNRFWKLNLPLEKLLQMARQLGSDVSFFLYGGTALAEGRGEIITPLPDLPGVGVAIVLPPVPPLPGKTRRLYESLRPNHFTDGEITRRAVEAIKAAEAFAPPLLFNTFENVAFEAFPGLAAAREHLLKLGADNVHLAGSGPTLFTLAPDKARAEELRALLRNQNISAFAAETI